MKENILFKTAARITSWLLVLLFVCLFGYAQKDTTSKEKPKTSYKVKRIFYGKASFYSNKFHGRQTANGEVFNQDKFTAACNILPLGTWIRVTNLSNGKTVVVRTTDRLHPRMRRVIDLSRSAAKRLDYINKGLTRVKVEVLDQQKLRK
jgi:rare lipoprotein A